jgi:hypothetical protein
LQAWQTPAQALAQHTPPTQNLLAHCELAAHAAPFERRGRIAPDSAVTSSAGFAPHDTIDHTHAIHAAIAQGVIRLIFVPPSPMRPI